MSSITVYDTQQLVAVYRGGQVQTLAQQALQHTGFGMQNQNQSQNQNLTQTLDQDQDQILSGGQIIHGLSSPSYSASALASPSPFTQTITTTNFGGTGTLNSR